MSLKGKKKIHHRNSRRKLSTKKRHHKKRRKYKTKRQAFTGGNADENQCSICFEFLDSEQQPLFTGAKCKHVFHAACINQWCNSRFYSINDCTCPLCRELLYEYNPDLRDRRFDDEQLAAMGRRLEEENEHMAARRRQLEEWNIEELSRLEDEQDAALHWSGRLENTNHNQPRLEDEDSEDEWEEPPNCSIS